MALFIATYISLPGTTADAMAHWQGVFGGEVEILRYRDVSMSGMPFEPDPDAVAHATLDFPGGHLAGSDVVLEEDDYPVRGTAYSLLVTTDGPDQARDYIAKFVAGGGEETMTFNQAPWGGWYGQVFDRFGVMWAFSCE